MFLEASFTIIRLDYVGDSIGTGITIINGLFEPLIKGLKKAKLGFLATVVRAFLKIPEYIYYALYKSGFGPQRVKQFRALPLGFTFCVRKV